MAEEDRGDLRARAENYRRIASTINDERTIRALHELADTFDALADSQVDRTVENPAKGGPHRNLPPSSDE
jgi:hypothetical protein